MSENRNISAVFFDLDGTLLDNREDFPSVFVRVLSDLGIERSVDDVGWAVLEAWDWYERSVGSFGGDEGAFWQEFNRRVCAAVGCGPRSAEAGRAVTRLFAELDRPVLYDDVLPCLDEVARLGYDLGVITARPDASRVVGPLDLDGRFSWVVDGFAAGSAKQDTRSFLHALDLAGLAPAEAVHVGDQIERDVEPARAAGLAAVLVDRHDLYREANCPRVTTLLELPALLGSL